MKAKFVNERLFEDDIERFDSEYSEETDFTPEQKKSIEDFIDSYQGNFEDDDIHDFAEDLGLDVHEVEEYIYDMARGFEKDSKEKDSIKKGFHTNIEKDTLQNKNFRKVLYTGENIQLVLMTLKPGEDIGMETHDVDQFFRFEKGEGEVIINNNKYQVEDGSGVIVPAEAKHNIINTGNIPLFMYTLYAPPHHKNGTLHKTKADAQMAEEEFDGVTSE